MIAWSQVFPASAVPPVPYAPTVLEDQVLPLLDEGRRAVPEERVLADDDVVGEQQILLAPDVDVEVRVGLVEVVDVYPLDRARRLEQGAVGPRPFERGVGEEEEDAELLGLAHRVIGRRARSAGNDSGRQSVAEASSKPNMTATASPILGPPLGRRESTPSP